MYNDSSKVEGQWLAAENESYEVIEEPKVIDDTTLRTDKDFSQFMA